MRKLFCRRRRCGERLARRVARCSVGRGVLVVTLMVALAAIAPLAAQRSQSAGGASAAMQAFAALEERRFGDALQGFEAALKSDPRNPDILIGAGVATMLVL